MTNAFWNVQPGAAPNSSLSMPDRGTPYASAANLDLLEFTKNTFAPILTRIYEGTQFLVGLNLASDLSTSQESLHPQIERDTTPTAPERPTTNTNPPDTNIPPDPDQPTPVTPPQPPKTTADSLLDNLKGFERDTPELAADDEEDSESDNPPERTWGGFFYMLTVVGPLYDGIRESWESKGKGLAAITDMPAMVANLQDRKRHAINEMAIIDTARNAADGAKTLGNYSGGFEQTEQLQAQITGLVEAGQTILEAQAGGIRPSTALSPGIQSGVRPSRNPLSSPDLPKTHNVPPNLARRAAPAPDNYRGRLNAERTAEGRPRLPDDFDAHHRIPQEYMDHSEFKDFDFHHPSNLQGVQGSRPNELTGIVTNTHQLITNEWANFRQLNPNATRIQIEDFTKYIDLRYSQHWFQ